jgi:hypothetical protein
VTIIDDNEMVENRVVVRHEFLFEVWPNDLKTGIDRIKIPEKLSIITVLTNILINMQDRATCILKYCSNLGNLCKRGNFVSFV